LRQWRSRYNTDPNFGYDLMRQDKPVCEAVEQSLFEEQGELDAYTEQRITRPDSHVEHLTAQTHCTPAETVAYGNMVLCYPGPNRTIAHPPSYHGIDDPSAPPICVGNGGAAYGANEKGAWPAPANASLFVSPLDPRCERRFTFRRRGCMTPSVNADQAAEATIRHLNLNHPTLRQYRLEAMDEARALSYTQAKQRLREIESETAQIRRTPFGAAVKHALRKHLQVLRTIAKKRPS
jgi:hypothetical protein